MAIHQETIMYFASSVLPVLLGCVTTRTSGPIILTTTQLLESRSFLISLLLAYLTWSLDTW